MPDISTQLKDRYFKIAGVPLTVFMVTALYNLFNTKQSIAWSFRDYFFYMIMAGVIWICNVKIHYLLRKQLYRVKKIFPRLLIRYSIGIAVSFVITLIFLFIWNRLFYNSIFTYAGTIAKLQVIIILVTVQISSIYEIAYLNNEREWDTVKMERTEKSKIQAELDVLKNQIDPHFIFNSLNTLSYLISQDQDKAKRFNDTLAKVYRYILIKKEKDLVQLKEEIEFAMNFFYLLKIRYQQGLVMKIEINNIISENYLLPPLSIQILIENAIKHNHFTEKNPLNIEIKVIEEHVTVTNNRHVKQFEIQSSQIGLKNLSERYKLITNSMISITDNKDYFRVTLPILKS
jgi:sensor histidine kinase YesM